MTKEEGVDGFYDDGLAYVFKDGENLKAVQPFHIHVEIQSGPYGEETEFNGLETCDLRLYSVKESPDLSQKEKNTMTVCSNNKWA